MLPLGVVIPTKNSMKYLPDHLENLATWIDLAAEVVVVDSFSSDGTLDYLKKTLRHPQIKFLTHPPGLYASWNYGIGQISSEFCYLSTIGDSITRAGLEHLVATASRLNCDVLVSRPNFVDERGQACEGPEWPMDFVIQRLRPKQPAIVPPDVVLATALLHNGGALSGSCSSDLFRTAVLQKHPFPLDYGRAGDGAWGLRNAGIVSWAVTPEKMTTFRIHPPVSSESEIKIGRAASGSDDFDQMTRMAISEWVQSDSCDASGDARKNIQQLASISMEYKKSHRRYASLRKGKCPWIFSPAAWVARSNRNRLKSNICKLMEKICFPHLGLVLWIAVNTPS